MNRLLVVTCNTAFILNFSVQAATFTVTSTNNEGPGSFRQAILDANSNPGADSIHFNLPASDTTIAPTNALPPITNAVTIDGFTQPGSRTNSLVDGNDAILKVRLDGTNISGSVPVRGLQLDADNNTVRGLVILSFNTGILIRDSSDNVIAGNSIGLDVDGVIRSNSGVGVNVSGSTFGASQGNRIGGTAPSDRNVISGNSQGIFMFSRSRSTASNLVQGNFIGTDATGRFPRGNSLYGIGIQSWTGTNNIIGGTVAGARNIISGNRTGILILDTWDCLIQGNYVGTDVTGMHSVSNHFEGIQVQDFGNHTIGGSEPGAGNLISGNYGDGLFILGGTNIIVRGNRIGTDLAGEPLPNRGDGIRVQGTRRSFIGGLEGEGNIVRYNTNAGIRMISGSENLIQGNSISENGELGIDLGNIGVTINDLDDVDTGANQLQNFPALQGAWNDSGFVRILGSLTARTNASYRLEFFANAQWDPSGYGEGGAPLGLVNVTTDSRGVASFFVSFSTPGALGQFISATATDSTNNTSEFSACVSIGTREPAPSLSLRPEVGAVEFAWLAGLTEPVLEFAPSLTPPVDWQPVANSVATNNAQRSVTIPIETTGPGRFFRLSRP